MENVVFAINGIDCASCSKKIESFLTKRFGDKVETSFNMSDFTLSVDYDPSIRAEEIEKAINDSGFKCSVLEE